MNYFLTQVARFEYLYISEPFQTFIRGPTDFLKPANDLKIVNYVQIGQSMRQLFPNYFTFQCTQESESQIEDACQYFKIGLDSLEKFEVICKENLENYNGLKDEAKNLLIGIRDVSDFYSEKYGGTKIDAPEREPSENPYDELLNWTRADILDLRSIIEAMQKRQEHMKIKGKVEERLEEERGRLLKLQSGKKSFGQLFSKKSKEDHIARTEGEIKKFEEEIESLCVILNVASARLVNEVIAEFKESKIQTFESIMRKFTEASIKEFSMFINEAKHLESKLT